jgi:hypothetical protein
LFVAGGGGSVMRRSTDCGVESPRFLIVARAYIAAITTPPIITAIIERQPTPAINPAVFQALLATSVVNTSIAYAMVPRTTRSH